MENSIETQSETSEGRKVRKVRTVRRSNGQALGRNLSDIKIASASMEPWKAPESAVPIENEVIRTADAIPSIIRTLADLPTRQVENVFSAVRAIQATANGDEQIIQPYTRKFIEREKAARSANRQRRGWFSWRKG